MPTHTLHTAADGQLIADAVAGLTGAATATFVGGATIGACMDGTTGSIQYNGGTSGGNSVALGYQPLAFFADDSVIPLSATITSVAAQVRLKCANVLMNAPAVGVFPTTSLGRTDGVGLGTTPLDVTVAGDGTYGLINVPAFTLFSTGNLPLDPANGLPWVRANLFGDGFTGGWWGVGSWTLDGAQFPLSGAVTLEISEFSLLVTYELAGDWYYDPTTLGSDGTPVGSYAYEASDPGGNFLLQSVAPTVAVTLAKVPTRWVNGVIVATSYESPAYGTAGTSLHLVGTGFGDDATVTVGGVSATSVVVNDSTSISCIVGAHANGAVNIVVTNADATTGTLVNGFTYVTPIWSRTFPVDVAGVEFDFDAFVTQEGASGPSGIGTWDLQPLVFALLDVTWFSYPEFGWWAYQVASPGTGWVDGGAGPVIEDGWFMSPWAFGGGIQVIAGSRPKSPRTWLDIVIWATGNTAMLGGSPAASCVFDNRMLYPATGYTVATDHPPIRVFNGSFDHELCKLPPTASNGVARAVMSMLTANGEVYVSSFDSGTSSADWRGRVFSLSPDSGVMEVLGTQFAAGEMPYALCWHEGRLWCGTNNGIGTVGKVYFFRPGIDTTWTLDYTTSSSTAGGVTSMASYLGKLYVGTDNAVGSRGKILVRDSAGAYTVSDTGSGGATAIVNNGYLAMLVFEGNLYASYWNNETPKVSFVHKFDGTTWTTAYTGSSTTLRPFILLVESKGYIFAIGGGLGLTGAIVSSPDGTTWTNLTALLPEADKTLLPIHGVEIL